MWEIAGQDDAHLTRHKTSIVKAGTINEMVVGVQNVRLSVKIQVRGTRISEGSLKAFPSKKICARWVTHMLTEEQQL